MTLSVYSYEPYEPNCVHRAYAVIYNTSYQSRYCRDWITPSNEPGSCNVPLSYMKSPDTRDSFHVNIRLEFLCMENRETSERVKEKLNF